MVSLNRLMLLLCRAARGGAVAALSAGTISASATGATEVTVTQTVAPSGGSGSITVVIYRHTSSFTPPGTGTNVGTSFPVVDTGLTTDTPYYYEAIYTDGASATAHSNEVSATPVGTSAVFGPAYWDATNSGPGADGANGLRITNNGMFDTVVNCDFASHGDVMTVDANGGAGRPPGNYLRVTVPAVVSHCRAVEHTTALPAFSAPGYVGWCRLVINVTDIPVSESAYSQHPVTLNGSGVIQAALWSIQNVIANTSYQAVMGLDSRAGSPGTGNDYWRPASAQADDVELEFQYGIEIVELAPSGLPSGATFRIHPYVYDSAGTELFGPGDFRRRSDGDTSEPLTDWYDDGGLFEFTDIALARRFGVGYEGGNGVTTTTGASWYYAAAATYSSKPAPLAWGA